MAVTPPKMNGAISSNVGAANAEAATAKRTNKILIFMCLMYF